MVLVSTSQYIDLEKGTDNDPPGSLRLSIAPADESAPPPITVTPATPADAEHRFPLSRESQDKVKRTASVGGDPSAGKKMQQMLRDRVHKGQEKISTISKKIGHGVVRNGGLHLRRSNSAPGMHRYASYTLSPLTCMQRFSCGASEPPVPGILNPFAPPPTCVYAGTPCPTSRGVSSGTTTAFSATRTRDQNKG